MSEEYYMTKESVDEYVKLSKGFDGAQLIDKLKLNLPVNSVVLEIGSGPGTDWKILKKDYAVVGSDNSPEFLKRLKTGNPEGEFIELDASTLETERKFDAVYSNKVLHHLKDEEHENSIKRQHEILNFGGIICHSYWKGDGSEMFKGLFVNYHSNSGLKILYEKYFDILLIEDYREFDDSDSIVLIGKKK